MKEYFEWGSTVTAKADVRLQNDTVTRLWHRFCYTAGEIVWQDGETCTFVMGDTALPMLAEGKEYALTVDAHGAAVVGRDYGGLVRGVIALLMKLEFRSLDAGEERFALPFVTEQSGYTVKNRMVHLCVFPEDDLLFFKKMIRLFGMCQYTHVVIEFWGMLQFDCLQELGWPQAFSKEQVKAVIREVRDLGMEPIPMFNSLGHASLSRGIYGKHVVLDQNLRLQWLYTPGGWTWDITSERVWEFLKTVRQELCELFGEGSYFHLGCDEAYYYTLSSEQRALMKGYLNRLTADVVASGRRPMLWMDMFLEKDAYENCYSAGVKGETDDLIAALAKETVMLDWQYDAATVPIPSTAALLKTGYDVMGAPWLRPYNYEAHIGMVEQCGAFGVMLTTWQTLKEEISRVTGCAERCGAATFPWAESCDLSLRTATLLRFVSFEGNTYADCGWARKQVEV